MMRYWAIADDVAVEVDMAELQTWLPDMSIGEWFVGVWSSRGNPSELFAVAPHSVVAGMHLIPLAPKLIQIGRENGRMDPRSDV